MLYVQWHFYMERRIFLRPNLIKTESQTSSIPSSSSPPLHKSLYLFLQHGDSWLLLFARLSVRAGHDEAVVTRPHSCLLQQRRKGSKDVGPHVLLALLKPGQQGGADGGVEGEEKVASRADQSIQTLDGGAPHLPAHVVIVTVLVV